MTTNIDEHEKARITKNIELAFCLAQEIVDDPSILDEIPDDATMILLPLDAPDVAESNLQGGVRLVRQGHDVTFRHVPSRERRP